MQNRKGIFVLVVTLFFLALIGGGLFWLLSKEKIEEVALSETSTEKPKNDIENMLKLAEYYMDKEEFDLARNQLENVLIQQPDNTKARRLLAEALSKKILKYKNENYTLKE